MQVIQSPSRLAKVYRLGQSDTNAPDAECTSSDTAPLVFVTGASRSGTTMLARMLGAHSAISAFNELHYFGSLWDPYESSRQFSGTANTRLVGRSSDRGRACME